MEKTKEYLSEYIAAQKSIEAYTDEREHLHYLATRIDSAEHPRFDTVGTGAAQIVDMDRQIQEAMRSMTEKRRRIEHLINSIEDGAIRGVLQLRYLRGLSFAEIAEKLHYCERWINVLHRRGLEEVKGRWENEQKS